MPVGFFFHNRNICIILANKRTIMVLNSFPDNQSKLRPVNASDNLSQLIWFCAC